MNTAGGEFFYPERYLRIENSALPPAEVARRIVEAFALQEHGTSGPANHSMPIVRTINRQHHSMAILALDHVQLAMPAGGEEMARSFYGGVLGMDEMPKPASLQASGGVWFRSGSAELHLGVEADFQPARKAHPALRVDDIHTLASRIQDAGHAVSWDDRYPGVRRFYVNDPFGNRLEILTPEAP